MVSSGMPTMCYVEGQRYMHHTLWEHAREGDEFEGDQRSFGEGGRKIIFGTTRWNNRCRQARLTLAWTKS